MAVARFTWHRSAEHSDAVKLVRTGRIWSNAYNITGVWVSGLSSYYFEVDETDTNRYDATELHEIFEGDGGGGGSAVITKIDLSSIKVAEDVETHLAATAAHGATGAVVGTTNAQTLTNKGIDDDNNTLTNVDLSTAVKPNTNAPAMGIKPAPASDTILFIDAADATSLTAQLANAAKTADRILNLKAGSIALSNDAGGAIKITGLAAGTVNGDVVRFNEFDALETRVDNLEAGAAWTGSPVVQLSLQAKKRMVRVFCRMSLAANEAQVQRYEFYWGETGFTFAAGLTASGDLAWMRSNLNKVLVRGGEGSNFNINTDNEVYVVAVAFDANNLAYNSASGNATPIGDPRYLSIDGATFQTVGGGISQVRVAAAAAGQVAAAPTDCLETSITPVIKWRADYNHSTDIGSLTIKFHAYQATAAHTSLVTIDVVNLAGAVQKTQAINVAQGAAFVEYDAVVDLTGLAAALYEIQASIQSSGVTGTSHLRGDVTVLPQKTLIV